MKEMMRLAVAISSTQIKKRSRQARAMEEAASLCGKA